MACSAEKLKKRFWESERKGNRGLAARVGKRKPPCRPPRPRAAHAAHPGPHPRPRTLQRPPQLVPPAGKPRADASGCCADEGLRATAQGRAEAIPAGVPGGSTADRADSFLGISPSRGEREVLRAAKPTQPGEYLQALSGRAGHGWCVPCPGRAAPGGLRLPFTERARVPGPRLQSGSKGYAPRSGPHRGQKTRAPRTQTEGNAQWQGARRPVSCAPEVRREGAGCGAGGLPGSRPWLLCARSTGSPSLSELSACQGRPQGPKRDLDLGWNIQIVSGQDVTEMTGEEREIFLQRPQCGSQEAP